LLARVRSDGAPSCAGLSTRRVLTGAGGSEAPAHRLCTHKTDGPPRRNQFHIALNAVAGLSEVDGCVVLDRGLHVKLFGGKIHSSSASGATGAKVLDLRDWYAHDVSIESEIRKLGTRNQSACQFCREHPRTFAFVISQDCDLRVYCSDDEAAYAFEALAPS